MGIGMQEMLIILLVVLVLFGAKKLPEIGGGLGRAIRNFRKAQEEPDEIDISAKKSEAPQQEAPRSVASEQASQEVKSETKQTVSQASPRSTFPPPHGTAIPARDPSGSF